ncbi:MAG: hypothetical protein AB7E72_14960 [Lysobacterales bacterium]
MNLRTPLLLAMALGLAQPAFAQLKPYVDYDTSTSVSQVSTVHVDANMIDYYLEGIRGTWVAAAEARKKLGQIEDYAVYVSELPLSGDFNVVLVTRAKSAADLEPSKERYDAFMQAWGAANEEKSKATTKTYPGIRQITGEYRLREITFK